MIVVSSILIILLLSIYLIERKQLKKETKKKLLLTLFVVLLTNIISFSPIALILVLIVIILIYSWKEINEKTKKKIYKICAITLGITLLFFILTPRWLYYRVLYLDDRVKITAKIYVDGEQMNIDEDFVTIGGKGIGKKHISSGDDGIKISFKGNEYENYHINMKIEPYHNDYYIDLLLQHWNWWDINRIDVVINIDTKENTISYSVENRFISEEKNYTEDVLTLSETKELSTINKLFLG
ncbi:MAG: hypothetical protein IKO78_02045 [Bacilli bacterium]|nr:hypothetical protein [Bacilli bacterium]